MSVGREEELQQYYNLQQQLRDMHDQTRHQTITQVLIIGLCAVGAVIVTYRSFQNALTGLRR